MHHHCPPPPYARNVKATKSKSSLSGFNFSNLDPEEQNAPEQAGPITNSLTWRVF